MPPKTRLQERLAEKWNAFRPRSAEPNSNVPSRGTGSLASVAMSAEGPTLNWDSIDLNLQGEQPPSDAAGDAAGSRPPSTPPAGSAEPSPNRRSRIPTPVRPTVTPPGSGRSSPTLGAAWFRPPPLYVTEARLGQVVDELRKVIELGDTCCADNTASRIPSYLRTMESRLVEQVIDSVSKEYNLISIGNIERSQAISADVSRLGRIVDANSQLLQGAITDLSGLTERVNALDKKIVDLGEDLIAQLDPAAIASEMALHLDPKFADHAALIQGEVDAKILSAVEALRSAFDAKLDAYSRQMRQVLNSETQSLARAIRSLSLRIPTPGHSQAEAPSRSPPHTPPRAASSPRVPPPGGRRGTGAPFTPQDQQPRVFQSAPAAAGGPSNGVPFRTSRPPLQEIPVTSAPLLFGAASSAPLGGRLSQPVDENAPPFSSTIQALGAPRVATGFPEQGEGAARPCPSFPVSPDPRPAGHNAASPPGQGRYSPSPPPSDAGTSSGVANLRIARLTRKVRLTCDLILATTKIDLSSVTSKAQIIEIITYDLPQLQELKATLVECDKLLDRLDGVDEELADLIESVTQSAIGWERSVTDLKRKFFLHLRPNNSLLKKVEIVPFTGKPDSETIFQFLDTFHRLADASCDPAEQADLLYNSYLSPEIQLEVFSFKTDLARIEGWLVAQYGDLRRIADLRVAKIASLRHPTSAQPQAVHIDYFKTVHQLLVHLESLSQCDRVDQSEIANIIFNSSWVTQLVSRLPEDVILAFTKLIEQEPRVPPPSGRRYFELLRDLIETTWRQLNTAQRIRSARDPAGNAQDSRKASAPRSSNNIGATGPSVPRPQSPKAATVQPNAKPVAGACPFHDSTTQAKHPLGRCINFFKSTNQQRLELCKRARACFSCLSLDCMRVSLGACITSQLPQELICGDCAQGKSKRPLSVLLCYNSAHAKPPLKTVQDALTRYLKPFDLKLVDHLRSQFHIAAAPIGVMRSSSLGPSGTSKSSPVDPSKPTPVFDTMSGATVSGPKSVRNESLEDTVYIFQLVRIGGHTGLVFYDSGATGNLVRGEFAEAAGFKVLDERNQMVGALGSTSMWTKYGIYSAILGDEVSGNYHRLLFQGIDQITSEFPRYDLAPLVAEVQASGQLNANTPFPRFVGGRATDILIGLKNSELQPRLLFTLPSGLGVYQCYLRDCWGSTLAFGGPHSLISAANRQFYGFSVSYLSVLLTQRKPAIMDWHWVSSDSSAPPSKLPFTVQLSANQSVMLDTTPLSPSDVREGGMAASDPVVTLSPHCAAACAESPGDPAIAASAPAVAKAKVPLARIRQLMDGDAEPVVSYRCPKCEDCQDCKASPMLKTSSLRERTEQLLIEASVRIDYQEERTYVRYPFLSDPVAFFRKHYGGRDSNLGQARIVYLQQCRKVDSIKDGVRAEMSKLLEAGFITPINSLPPEIQNLISSAPVRHYFPWRSVSKLDSVSTPTRLVVDPSMTLLNANLAKGDPQLASMYSVLLRSRASAHLWSADIKKLYNTLVLENDCLPYSLFLYNPSLNPAEEPQTFVLLRAWYGTASTSGQATFALRKLGQDHVATHPLGSRVLLNDTYVDDLLRATASREESAAEAAEVQDILKKGGMSLKFVSYSGDPPPEEASHDANSMLALGYRYVPEADTLSLNLDEVNFKTKVRGAKPPNPVPCNTPSMIEEALLALPQLTRRHVVAKSAELFDPLGLFEPYKAMLKRALSNLNGMDWDDPVPEPEFLFWRARLVQWPELGKLCLPRSTVPSNALLPLQARLICNTDASQNCAGACVYLSFRTSSGEWSSQLLTAKSRLVNNTVPRNELEALVIGVELTFAVLVSIQIPIQSVTVASDSLVALSWAMNERARHKTFVFNRVLTIQRYMRWIRDLLSPSAAVEIVHIPGDQNAADLLTKGEIAPSDLRATSLWQVGPQWMSLDLHMMPLMRYSDISLSPDETERFLSETLSEDALMVQDIPEPHSYYLYPTDSPGGETTACVIKPRPEARPPISLSFVSFGEGTHSMLESENEELSKLRPGLVHLINPIRLGWSKANRMLNLIVSGLVKLLHNTHLSTANAAVRESLSKRCPYCISSKQLSESTQGSLEKATAPFSDHELQADEQSHRAQVLTSVTQVIVNYYWDIRSTLLCKSRLPPKEVPQYEEDPERGILFYKGRVAPDASIAVVDLEFLDLAFLDGREVAFCNPCIFPDTAIFYAFAVWVHFFSAPHMGIEATLAEIMKRFHPIRPRTLLARLLGDCVKCKILRRKVLEHEMAKHKAPRLTFAPPFTFTMGDIAQDFMCKSRFTGRQTMKAPALVLCCLLSGATAIYMMEDWSTTSVMQALERHGSRHGFPSQLFVDSGSQLKKLSSVAYSILDLTRLTKSKFHCDLVVAPPKSHSSQGRVERRIGLIKTSLSKVAESGFLLSFLEWETLFARIANELNNLPVARASATHLSRPEWAVLTPNRLLLGRNNKRSLAGPLVIDATPSTSLERSFAAQEEWYKIFSKQLHLFVPTPKWFKTNKVATGDIVLFFLDVHMKSTGTTWHFGLVVAVSGLTLTIEYTVPPSNLKKSLKRSRRDVVRLAHESELDFNTELHALRISL